MLVRASPTLIGAAALAAALFTPVADAQPQGPGPGAGPGAGAGRPQGGGGPMGSIERGRYLAKIAGCNDCHTPGYAQNGGKVPEVQWLVGDKVGFRGPWGTTYPANLRMLMQTMSQAEWMKYARTKEMRPPMPWFALRDMTNQDLASIYRFVRHLGPGGEAAPDFVPPGKEPQGPAIVFPG